MSSAIMSKVYELLGIERDSEEELEEDIYDYEYEEDDSDNEEKKGFLRKNKVVPIRFTIC